MDMSFSGLLNYCEDLIMLHPELSKEVEEIQKANESDPDNFKRKKAKKRVHKPPNQIDRCLGSAKVCGSPLRLHFSKPSGIPLAGKGQPVAL